MPLGEITRTNTVRNYVFCHEKREQTIRRGCDETEPSQKPCLTFHWFKGLYTKKKFSSDSKKISQNSQNSSNFNVLSSKKCQTAIKVLLVKDTGLFLTFLGNSEKSVEQLKRFCVFNPFYPEIKRSYCGNFRKFVKKTDGWLVKSGICYRNLSVEKKISTDKKGAAFCKPQRVRGTHVLIKFWKSSMAKKKQKIIHVNELALRAHLKEKQSAWLEKQTHSIVEENCIPCRSFARIVQD